jgi:hypothetical protein
MFGLKRRSSLPPKWDDLSHRLKARALLLSRLRLHRDPTSADLLLEAERALSAQSNQLHDARADASDSARELLIVVERLDGIQSALAQAAMAVSELREALDNEREKQ